MPAADEDIRQTPAPKRFALGMVITISGTAETTHGVMMKFSREFERNGVR